MQGQIKVLVSLCLMVVLCSYAIGRIDTKQLADNLSSEEFVEILKRRLNVKSSTYADVKAVCVAKVHTDGSPALRLHAIGEYGRQARWENISIDDLETCETQRDRINDQLKGKITKRTVVKVCTPAIRRKIKWRLLEVVMTVYPRVSIIPDELFPNKDACLRHTGDLEK